MALGDKIQSLRKAGGLSQEQLAQALNVSRQSVSKWELNESIPDLDKLVSISKLFSVSIDVLVKDENHTPSGKAERAPLEQIAKINAAHRQIRLGFITMIIGIILFILEYAFLPVYGYIHKTVVDGQGFYTDAMQYANVQPMPVIFTLTAVIIAAGVCFMAIGFIGKKRKANK